MRRTNMRLTQFRETLDLNIERDVSTNLPFLKEREKVLKLILAHLPLPYNVAEYGCGKKCSIILKKLMDIGIPAFALKRGMIMEKDMSPTALEQEDFNQRKYALVVENPLFHLVDFEGGSLEQMLEEKGIKVSDDKSEIQAGKFILTHKKLLHFKQARTHIFAIVTFWDDENEAPVELGVDPTIRSDELFKVNLIKRLLNSNEALVFTAPMLGHFHLDEKYLSNHQKWALSKLTGDRRFSELSLKEMNRIVMDLTGASKGSIGDPHQWTYANNIRDEDHYNYDIQRKNTGRGDRMRPLLGKLLAERSEQSEKVLMIRDQLIDMVGKLGIKAIIQEDARLAEESLEVLADVDNTITYHDALSKLRELMEADRLYDILTRELEQLTGIVHNLQDRIETLAILSRNREGEIDARSLNEYYLKSVVETIRQMNAAGLHVFIDDVGNIHGLMMDDPTEALYQANELSIKEIAASSICHCSHIDTVKDAGKYDGRLGVLSGIQIADIIHSLQKYFGVPLLTNAKRCLMVSAFIGEEMTFTGKEVSMPGSGAVTGNFSLEQIYHMQNADGELFREKLTQLLSVLKKYQAQGEIELMNEFATIENDEKLLDACFDCTDFFTAHTYERHIEQGPILDRKGAPLALVETIMGIHQEDFVINGERAAEAALELNLRFRERALKNYDSKLRATVGIMEEDPDTRKPLDHTFVLHWTLQGAKNHAGATLMEDRRDPGVAAARLANKFKELVEDIRNQKQIELRPLIGGIQVIPGANRNVIPDSLLYTLGVAGADLDDETRYVLNSSLQNYVLGTLSKEVHAGGEGIINCFVETLDFSNTASCIRISLDLRGAESELMKNFVDDIKRIVEEIEKQFNVSVARSVEQMLEPYSLETSGQVLQIERSYGGSHNPNEAQLINDLLRGTLLQFAVSVDILHRPVDSKFNLYRYVDNQLPDEWRMEEPFVSGALHDTCNIAARVQRGIY